MKYRLKPVEVEAMQFRGNAESMGELLDWMDGPLLVWSHEGFKLMTLHGPARIAPDEWIIKDSENNYWRCPAKDFMERYEPIESEA